MTGGGSASGGEDRASLLGATPQARWSFLLGGFVVFTFSEAWMKPFNGGGVEPADNALIRMAHYPAYVAGLVLVGMGPLDALAALRRTPLVWGLVAFAFVSTLWSIDPAATDRRAVALLFSTLCGVAVAARLSWTQLTRMLALCLAGVSLVSLVLAVLIPTYGRMQEVFPGAWSGVFVEKNGLGAWAAQTLVACAAAFVIDPRRRWAWAAGSALGAGLLLASTSKTALVVARLGCRCFAFAWAVRRGPAAAVTATFLGVVAVGATAFAVAFSPDTLLGLLGKDATLTGRTRIWAAVVRQIATRPRTGFGYGAVWSDQTGWGPVYWVVKQYGARPAYAHNGWIDLWLGLGVYAVWMWAALLALTWITTLAATYSRSDALLALPFLAMFTLTNLTESSIVLYNAIGWVLFVMLAAKVLLPDRPSAGAPLPQAQRGASRIAPSSRIVAAFR